MTPTLEVDDAAFLTKVGGRTVLAPIQDDALPLPGSAGPACSCRAMSWSTSWTPSSSKRRIGCAGRTGHARSEVDAERRHPSAAQEKPDEWFFRFDSPRWESNPDGTGHASTFDHQAIEQTRGLPDLRLNQVDLETIACRCFTKIATQFSRAFPQGASLADLVRFQACSQVVFHAGNVLQGMT